jgi:hypothetical protein
MTQQGDDSSVPAHLVALPGTSWTVWRDAILRTTGFPADGLDRLSAPGCAALADRLLDRTATEQEFLAAYQLAAEQASREVREIAADPLFREAVVWQNPGLASKLARLAEGRPSGTAKASRRAIRQRGAEDLVARYWQRYCGKNETVGFFGPVTWVTIDPEQPETQVNTGERLTRTRQVYFEYWALERLAALLSEDPRIRPWLPVRMHPHLTLDGGQVLGVREPPVDLSAEEAELLRKCDGRSAHDILNGADGLKILQRLAELNVVHWGFDLPHNPRAEAVLRDGIAALGDPQARHLASGYLTRLDAARDAVAAAVGDPERLAAALAQLDAEFTQITGSDPARRPGLAYAGRRLCYEETVRDIDITIGRPVLDAIAAPLAAVLPAARWLSVSLIDAYRAAFTGLYRKAAAESGTDVPLARIWFDAMGLLWGGWLGGGGSPADAVAAEFTRRWSALFGLDDLPDGPGTAEIKVTSEDIAPSVAATFAADGPAWPAARIHSPDLHVCAPSVDALIRGEVTAVMGELHATWVTADCAVFVDRHPEPRRLYEAFAADIGPQFRPLYPTAWPGYTGRIAPLLGETDRQLAFAATSGADPSRVVPVSALTVVDSGSELMVRHLDGRTWPLWEVFAVSIGSLGTRLFRFTQGAAHTPRICVDRLIVARQTWCTTIGATGLARQQGDSARYLAVRRWRRELGLPERVFVRIATESKPVYADFTSVRYVSNLCTMVRSAWMRSGDEVKLTISELLPVPEDAWVPDAAGRRYFSELRLQLRDPRPPLRAATA